MYSYETQKENKTVFLSRPYTIVVVDVIQIVYSTRVTTTSSFVKRSVFFRDGERGTSLEEITSSVIKEIRHSIWHVLESFIASLGQFLDCGVVHVNPAVYADVINVGSVVTSSRRFAVMIHH